MNNRIRGFDGVRAIAVLLVFLQHRAGAGPGHLGVWTFFVLSGFLIAGILTRQRSSIDSGVSDFATELKSFLFRRSIRIFPIYYLVLGLLTVFVSTGMLSREYQAGIPFHFAYLSNIWIGFIQEDWPGPFSHFWSLAVEEQFYLFFAPLLLAVPARLHRQVCVLIVVGGLASLFYLMSNGARDILLYTHPLTNFWMFALGGIGYYAVAGRQSAQVRHRPFQSMMPLALILSLVVLYAFESRWENASTSIYVAARLYTGGCIAMLICWIACNSSSLLVRLLEVRWLAALGRISYGFYLFHALVPTLSTSTRLRMLLGDGGLPAWARYLDVPVAFIATVAISALSWKLIEKPILRLKTGATPFPAGASSILPIAEGEKAQNG